MKGNELLSISDRIKSIGTYGVVLNEAHFKDLLFEVVPPPAVMQNKNTSNLIKMGFPKRLVEDNATFCVWYATITEKKKNGVCINTCPVIQN